MTRNTAIAHLTNIANGTGRDAAETWAYEALVERRKSQFALLMKEFRRVRAHGITFDGEGLTAYLRLRRAGSVVGLSRADRTYLFVWMALSQGYLMGRLGLSGL